MDQDLKLKRKQRWLKQWGWPLAFGGVIGLIAGVTDFSFGEFFAPARTDVWATIGAASVYVVLCLVQGVLVLIAQFSPKLRLKTGIEAQFGDGPKARAGLWRLGSFWFLNGLFLTLLGYTEFGTPSPSHTILLMLAGLGFAVLMVICTYQLWALLDELVRNIWIEATALTSGIMLLGAMLMGLGTSLNWVTGITLYESILAYNYLYLIIYFSITAIRSPAVFTNPTLEDG